MFLGGKIKFVDFRKEQCQVMRNSRRCVEYINQKHKTFAELCEIRETETVCMHGPLRHNHPSGSIPCVSSSQVGQPEEGRAEPARRHPEAADWDAGSRS